jgi:hypothetical protein
MRKEFLVFLSSSSNKFCLDLCKRSTKKSILDKKIVSSSTTDLSHGDRPFEVYSLAHQEKCGKLALDVYLVLMYF